MPRGGRNATNVPKLKGGLAQGSKPAGKSGVVPNGQYPTVIGTKKMPMTPDPWVANPGDTTVNSTPAD